MQTTNRLQAMLDDASNRMATSQIYHFSVAALKSTSIVTSKFYEDGPVCLYATIPEYKYGHASIIEAYMIGVYSSLKTHRLMHNGRMIA